MTTTQLTIEQLKMLPLPPSVSYLPNTWGWLFLLFLVVGIALWLGGLRLWRWHRNRYRRIALSMLDQLYIVQQQDRQALRQLPNLLKRTLLSGANPPHVAALSGADWQLFLAKSSTQPIQDTLWKDLTYLAYGPPDFLERLTQEEISALFATCRTWLEYHHVSV